MFIFYYKGGDTTYYFEGSRTLVNTLLHNPIDYFRFMFSSHHFEPDLMYIRSYITYSKSTEEWFMVRLLSPIVLISFNRYLVAQVLMSFMTVFGSWKMFQAFLIFYPKKQKEAFYAVFLVPSIILWGSGLLKDSVTFSFLSIFFYYSVKTFFLYQFKPNTLLLLSYLLISYLW